MAQMVEDAGSGQARPARVLVTTALEEVWPSAGRVVFLGSWCLRYSREAVWSKVDHTVAQYHWDDRSRIPQDLAYVSEVYEALLLELAELLNEIHGVRHSVRYWRIVVGWWLFYFAQIIFDRWQVVMTASVAYPDATLLRLPHAEAIPASTDMATFIEAMVGDAWNERIFADLAERWTGLPVKVVEGAQHPHSDSGKIPAMPDIVRQSRRGRVSGAGVALHSVYLNRSEKIKLELLLHQIPSIESKFSFPKMRADPQRRNWVVNATDGDRFTRVIADLIPKYLPTCYLEGYADASLKAEVEGPARTPKVVVTANAFSSDDGWKMWAGLQCERGAKLVITQHGGHYGTGAWSASQMHEIAISDRYLSWGWRDSNYPTVRAAPATKLIGMHKRSPQRNGSCLQVVTSFPRQSYWLSSIPVGPQGEEYFNDQFAFAAALSQHVRDELIVRLYSSDYGWDQAQRWKDVEPEITTDGGRSDLSTLLDDTRLYVATYNATTFLESFTQGVPTVMFWNPEFWELSESAKPFFDLLRKAGVLFDDPVTCASHVNSIWEDVPAWWAFSDVQAAVNEFCNQYAFVGRRPLRDLKAALTQW